MKKVRVMHVTEMQQKIISLHLDGHSREQIMNKLNLYAASDVENALMQMNRITPKKWNKKLSDCLKIFKEWNAAGVLMLLVCLMPLMDNNHNTERVKTHRARTARKNRDNEVDIFDLF